MPGPYVFGPEPGYCGGLLKSLFIVVFGQALLMMTVELLKKHERKLEHEEQIAYNRRHIRDHAHQFIMAIPIVIR